MHTPALPAKFRMLFSALCLSLTFQSCNKEVETVLPTQSSTADVTTVPATCKSVCLVAGRTMYVGTVDVALDANYLYVTYNITKPGVYLLETHADIFDTQQNFRNAKKLSGGGAIPGKFAYKASWRASDRKTSYTVTIPRTAVDALGANCFNIASHAALSNGETAWGGLCTETRNGVTLNGADQFQGANWGTYFSFCKDACAGPADFTYAWEDLRNTGNDADYNDLVIKSAITKTNALMEIKFTASARGAGYDHAFKFTIPKTGVDNVYVTPPSSVQDNGMFYTVTVFPSTKAALPGSGASGFANTVAAETCVNPAVQSVSIAINSAFLYNPARPYEPFISVYTSGTATGTPSYDLDIYDLVAKTGDTWTDAGKAYPNGILIPADWKWPLEQTRITLPYPTFTSLTDGFTTTWADVLADPSKVSTCN